MDDAINIHIITRCTRLNNLPDIEDSVFNSPKDVNITWHLIFDIGSLIEVPTHIFDRYRDKNVKFHFEKVGNRSLSVVNSVVKTIKDLNDWIYFLDDDNIIHKNFYSKISEEIRKNPNKNGFIFSQDVDFKDFSKAKIRIAQHSSVKLRHIDLAQYFIKRCMFSGDHWFKPRSWGSDGVFIENLYNEKKNEFNFITDVLCHYNYLEKVSSARIPKVLYIGNDKPEMKTDKSFSRHATDLTVKYSKDDKNFNKVYYEYEPDAILLKGNSLKEFPNIAKTDFSVRKKCILIDNDNINNIGQHAYNVAMHQILRMNRENTVSYFTPIYNTGKKLWNTYEGLKNQTRKEWEWVLVNDSTDMGKTLKIAQEIARTDPRVKVYDFRDKSGGCIGEAKYRACMLAKGHMIAELDHDDHVTPRLTEWLQKASEDHPDCGFFYTDCAVVEANSWNPKWFKGLHAFGYGNYRDEVYKGKNLKVTNQHNINPATIRHIVGIPNHVRAWRRDTYLKIGGHNRDLSIADDYELVVRTFLTTKLCRIPHLGYIQFHYTGQERNTHDIVRGDIQRRVRSIANFYHKDIKKRFNELGLNDWAYKKDPNNTKRACLGPWPTGKDEQVANEIWMNGED